MSAFHGEWRDAVQTWANRGLHFHGFFLDFCHGCASQLLRDLLHVTPLLQAPAVVAWTLVQREYGGQTWSGRLIELYQASLGQAGRLQATTVTSMHPASSISRAETSAS